VTVLWPIDWLIHRTAAAYALSNEALKKKIANVLYYSVQSTTALTPIN
jgi:hypothetical protein